MRAVARRPERWPLRVLLGAAALAALPLLLMVPITSDDYLAYLFAGRALSVYHLSPWHHALAELPGEFRYLSPATWGPDLKCIYGPVWVAVMAVTTGLVHLFSPGAMTAESLFANIFLLRLANLLALGAAAAAVWQINGRLWPEQQRLATAAFVFNPLLIWESLGALHNDIWGVAFLLWALALFLRGKASFTLALALSILTKYLALAITPVLAVYCWRRRDWPRLGWLAGAALAALGLSILTDPAYVTAHLTANVESFAASPTSLPLLVVAAGSLWHKVPDVGTSVLVVARILTFLFVPIYLTLVGRTRTREDVIRHSLWILVLYLTGAYLQTMQWYYVWPLGLLCLSRWTRATAHAAWSSCAILLGYVMYFWTHGGWSPGSLVLSFLLAIALPGLLCLVGHRFTGSLCPVPADAAPAGDRAPARTKSTERERVAQSA
jgi:hypothetical protein